MIRRLLSSAALTLILSLPPAVLAAQERASLISDRIEILGDSTLVASGNVEIFFKGNRLSASQVRYHQISDRISVIGPMVLTDADDQAVILASQAEMSADLREGLLQSARLMLNQQLQLAARSLSRAEGRYTAMDEVVASSCSICATNPIPLWEIRARKILHDSEAKQLWFDQARLHVMGVPVFYIPRLRVPDPTLDRLTGFLPPRIRSTSELGTGIETPYFITLGDHRDLTLSPFITTKGYRTLDMRYRQAFVTGAIELNAAVSHDGLTEDKRRGYATAEGRFELPEDVILSFDLKAASDNAYLLDYGYSGVDRLESNVDLSRVRRNSYFSTRLTGFQSLRDEEDNSTLPSLVLDGTFHRRFSLGALGGEGGLRLQSHNLYRTSDSPLDPDGDGIADGRDTSRLSARIDWRKSVLLDPGIEVTALGEAQLDRYRIRQDQNSAGDFTRHHTSAGVELRWPWLKASTSGATHVIEPVVQLIWSDRNKTYIPNEDSRLVEFDEGNLFSLDRFPGADAVEQSQRANIGVTYTRFDPQGWSTSFTLGRVLRNEDYGLFSPASGLDGRQSDWLTAASINWANGFATTARAVFDDDADLTKSELRLSLKQEKFTFSTSAIWAIADAAENRPEATRQVVFDAAWDIRPELTTTFEASYDFEASHATLAGMGVEYRTECVLVDLSLSRRFTSSTSVTPTTSFGLSVELIGFGSGKTAGPSRRCS